MVTYSHFLPGESHGQTEKPGRLRSTGSQRVGHDGSDTARRHECMDPQLAHQYISTKFDNLDLTKMTYSFPTLCYMTFFARHTFSPLVTEFNSGGCDRNGFWGLKSDRNYKKKKKKNTAITINNNWACLSHSSDILETALGSGCPSPKAGWWWPQRK